MKVVNLAEVHWKQLVECAKEEQVDLPPSPDWNALRGTLRGVSLEIQNFGIDMIAWNSVLLDALVVEREAVAELRKKMGLESPGSVQSSHTISLRSHLSGLEDIDLVRQTLDDCDLSVRQLPTDLGNHLIRVVGIQSRLQELMQVPTSCLIFQIAFFTLSEPHRIC